MKLSFTFSIGLTNHENCFCFFFFCFFVVFSIACRGIITNSGTTYQCFDVDPSSILSSVVGRFNGPVYSIQGNVIKDASLDSTTPTLVNVPSGSVSIVKNSTHSTNIALEFKAASRLPATSLEYKVLQGSLSVVSAFTEEGGSQCLAPVSNDDVLWDFDPLESGSIVNWLVWGPASTSVAQSCGVSLSVQIDALGAPHIGKPDGVSTWSEYVPASGGISRCTTEAACNNGRLVDLGCYFGSTPNTASSAYAFTFVYSPVAQSATLIGGSVEAMVIFVNDRRVAVTDPSCTCWDEKSLRSLVVVELVRGTNKIVLKIGGGSSSENGASIPFGFDLRLVDEDNNPLSCLKVGTMKASSPSEMDCPAMDTPDGFKWISSPKPDGTITDWLLLQPFEQQDVCGVSNKTLIGELETKFNVIISDGAKVDPTHQWVRYIPSANAPAINCSGVQVDIAQRFQLYPPYSKALTIFF
jgi:hypothetical protein